MYVYIYIYIDDSNNNNNDNMYTYIISTCVSNCNASIYLSIHPSIYLGPSRSWPARWPPCSSAAPRKSEPRPTRKGTNGVSTNGVTANVMFVERGTFWVLLF